MGSQRNVRCWCASGKKWKRCHGSAAPPTTPAGVILDRIAAQHFGTGTCLYPGSTCAAPVASHTIQRSGPLARITDAGNRVATFRHGYRKGRPDFSVGDVGWRQASTFPGFCAAHDRSVFSPIEAEPFVHTRKQGFLVAYRAVSYEVQRKRAAVAAQPQMEKLIQYETGTATTEEDALYRMALKHSLGELGKQKRDLDQVLLGGTWSRWHSRCFRFRGDLAVAVTALTSPEHDLAWAPLQDLGDLSVPAQPVTIATIALEGGSSEFTLVFGWWADSTVGAAFSRSIDVIQRSLLSNRLGPVHAN